MLHDLNGVQDQTLEFDLVIVGAGPAGLVIAAELLGSGLRVAVLESGGETRSDRFDALDDFENAGHTRALHHQVHCRGLGGASNIWTGRCGMLDAIDFYARPWLNLSGWPVTQADLRPYYHRAGPYLGLAATLTGTQAARDLYQSFDNPPWDNAAFADVSWQFSNAYNKGSTLVRQIAAADVAFADGVGVLQHSGRTKAVNMGERLRRPLSESRDIQLFLHATASEIETDPAGKAAQAVLVPRPDGAQVRFRGRSIVIAAGGIENARLLLASRGAKPRGLGNDRDQVGRYLTDHHFTEIGRFRDGGGRGLRRRFGSRWHRGADARTVYCMGLRLSEAWQRDGEFLNVAISMVDYGSRLNGLTTLANAARSLRARDTAALRGNLLLTARQPRSLVESALDRLVRKRPPLDRPELTLLGCVVEQELNPESRVTLSDQQNWLAQPRARIDWRLSPREHATALAVVDTFEAEVARLGLETPARPDWVAGGYDAWRARLIDLAHPSCTTRMSDDPATGVVDADCRVHGVDGLFVAGSSVFATPGYMNPTHTIVALGIRLADHLKAGVFAMHPRTAPTAVKPAPAALRTPASNAIANRPPLRAGFVGGGHRVAGIYAAVLKALADRVEVASVVTNSEAGAARIAAQTGWTAGTDLSRMIADAAPDLLIVALPPGMNDGAYREMVDLGLPLLLETPFCWNEMRGHKLLKKIRDSRRLVSVAEQFPFLPEFALWRRLIDLGLIGRVEAVINDLAIYDYHGIGLTRSLIGRDRRPVRAQANATQLGGRDDALFGSVRFQDGSLLIHNYSASAVHAAGRASGEVRVLGQRGTLLPGRVILTAPDGEPFEATVQRHEGAAGLLALSVATPDGEVRWENPHAGHGLTDEQVAVAQLVAGMVDAVRDAAPPPYQPSEALEDVELLAAMRYSAERAGKPITLPHSPLAEKLRRKARQAGRKAVRKLAGPG